MTDIINTHALISTDNVHYKLSHSTGFFDIRSCESQGSHIHNCIELYLNISGDVSFLVKNSVYPICRGDLIVTRANELHHCVYHASCVHEHFCLWMDDRAGDITAFLKESDINHICPGSQEREELISLFYSAYRATEIGDSLAASAHIMNILLILRKGCSISSAESAETLPRDFQQILDYINTNYAEITSARRITDEFFISLSTLNRRFAKYLHMSPKEYLESVRLATAKRMLDEGQSVTNVCFSCGYSDSSHFIRNFKRKFHTTPHKYKAKR